MLVGWVSEWVGSGSGGNIAGDPGSGRYSVVVGLGSVGGVTANTLGAGR